MISLGICSMCGILAGSELPWRTGWSSWAVGDDPDEMDHGHLVNSSVDLERDDDWQAHQLPHLLQDQDPWSCKRSMMAPIVCNLMVKRQLWKRAWKK